MQLFLKGRALQIKLILGPHELDSFLSYDTPYGKERKIKMNQDSTTGDPITGLLYNYLDQDDLYITLLLFSC